MSWNEATSNISAGSYARLSSLLDSAGLSEMAETIRLYEAEYKVEFLIYRHLLSDSLFDVMYDVVGSEQSFFDEQQLCIASTPDELEGVVRKLISRFEVKYNTNPSKVKMLSELKGEPLEQPT